MGKRKINRNYQMRAAEGGQTEAEFDGPVRLTGIHKAAKDGDVAQLRGLLAQGVKVDARDRFYSRTPLMWAVQSKQTEAIKYLIRKGANVNAEDCDGCRVMEIAVCVKDTEAQRDLRRAGAR